MDPSTTRVFALTGGYASGKSTVAAFFRELGVPIVSADELARDVVAPGSPGLAALRAAFGAEMLDRDGSLDRARLGQLVFGDPAARQRLEELLHPRIRQAAEERFAELRARGEQLVGYDVPLLFETGQAERYRPVVVVTTSPAAQVERGRQRDGHAEEAVLARLAAQWPLERKIAEADHVIDNSGSLAETRAQTQRILAALRGSR